MTETTRYEDSLEEAPLGDGRTLVLVHAGDVESGDLVVDYDEDRIGRSIGEIAEALDYGLGAAAEEVFEVSDAGRRQVEYDGRSFGSVAVRRFEFRRGAWRRIYHRDASASVFLVRGSVR